MKKALALWSVAALLIGCLTACKPTAVTPPADDGSSNASSTTTTTTLTEQGGSSADSTSSENVTSTDGNESTSTEAGSSTDKDGTSTSTTTSATTTKSGSSQSTTKTTTTTSTTTVKKTTTTKKTTTAKPTTTQLIKPSTQKTTTTTNTTTTTTKATTTTTKPTSTKLTPIAESNYYGRKMLKQESAALLKLYDRLVDAVKQHKDAINIEDLSVSADDAERVLQYYEDDYPQHYYVDFGNVSYSHRSNVVVDIYLKYLMSPSQVKSADAAIENVVKKILTGVYDSVPAEEREHIIYTHLIQHVDYKVGDEAWRHTMYGALVKGEGVCDAYSKAMVYLLNRAGIPCIRAFGYSHDQAHAWNMVQLYGDWYHVDATWDDPVMAGTPDFVGHTYLNVTTEALQEHHQITGAYGASGQLISYPLPKANSTKYHYFHRTETIMSKYDHDKVLDLCEYAVDHDTWWVGFYVSGSINDFLAGFAADYYNLKADLDRDGYVKCLDLGVIEYNDDEDHHVVYIHIT